MKKKFIILTLCFTLVFSSLNYKKSYADGGIISLPMLAVVSTLAVGTGIALTSSDDIYDIGRLFYDYVSTNNSLTWDVIKTTFNTTVSVLENGFISVDSVFLDIVKGFFDNLVGDGTSDINNLGSAMGVSLYPGYTSVNGSFSNEYFDIYQEGSVIKIFYNGEYIQGVGMTDLKRVAVSSYDNYSFLLYIYAKNSRYDFYSWFSERIFYPISSVVSIPYTGGYSWDDNVEDKKTGTGDLPLPIPGNLGNLLGKSPSDIWSNTNDLVGTGDLSIPNVDNPSISLEGSTSFPTVGTDTDTGIGSPSTPPAGLPEFPHFGNGIDFSPITESNISDKFPFCLAKDLSDIIKVFDVPEKEPIFKFNFLNEVYEIDFTQFKLLADIIKFFVLVTFIFGLIKITRGIIG